MCKMQANRRGLILGIYFLVAVLVVVLDQWTKHLAVLYLKPIRSVPLWRGVFHLTYLENRGAAFGMLQGQRWLFLVITVLITIGVVAYLLYDKTFPVAGGIALSMIVGGGIGNLFDRMATGAVVDFFDFTLINFAIFNVADVFVCVGAGLLLFVFIRQEIHAAREAKHE